MKKTKRNVIREKEYLKREVRKLYKELINFSIKANTKDNKLNW